MIVTLLVSVMDAPTSIRRGTHPGGTRLTLTRVAPFLSAGTRSNAHGFASDISITGEAACNCAAVGSRLHAGRLDGTRSSGNGQYGIANASSTKPPTPAGTDTRRSRVRY